MCSTFDFVTVFINAKQRQTDFCLFLFFLFNFILGINDFYVGVAIDLMPFSVGIGKSRNDADRFLIFFFFFFYGCDLKGAYSGFFIGVAFDFFRPVTGTYRLTEGKLPGLSNFISVFVQIDSCENNSRDNFFLSFLFFLFFGNNFFGEFLFCKFFLRKLFYLMRFF